MEPVVDPSQDYVLMLGYENATHTVMRFKRKLDTCDTSYDIAISVSFLFVSFLNEYIKEGKNGNSIEWAHEHAFLCTFPIFVYPEMTTFNLNVKMMKKNWLNP